MRTLALKTAGPSAPRPCPARGLLRQRSRERIFALRAGSPPFKHLTEHLCSGSTEGPWRQGAGGAQGAHRRVQLWERRAQLMSCSLVLV